MDIKNNRKINKGLTLVEVVVAVSIFSVIILGAISVLDFGQKSFETLNNNGKIQSEAYHAVTVISSQVRESAELEVYQTGLELIDGSGQNVSISWDGTAKLIQVNNTSGGAITLSEHAANVEFSPLTNGVNIYIRFVSGKEEHIVNTKALRRY